MNVTTFVKIAWSISARTASSGTTLKLIPSADLNHSIALPVQNTRKSIVIFAKCAKPGSVTTASPRKENVLDIK
jgi:hypothetical protein